MDFYLDHGWDGGNGYHHLTRDHNMNMVTYEVYSDVSYFKTESNQTIMPFLNEYMARYNETKDIGYISFLTNNHDMARLTHFYNEHELRLIYCMLFTMPGVPYLYYGDEIGMRFLPVPTKEGGYDRTGSRTPMQWNHNKNAGFSKANKKDIYLPVDEELDNRTVVDQLSDPNSLLNHIKTLIALRNDNPCLRSVNNIHIIYASYDKKLFIYQRDEFYFVCNPSVYEEQFSLPEEVEFVYGVGEATVNTIKPSSFAIFKRK
jgi:maltose alpha-D-glucosyltransferase/alpha-amylase